ncbi:hypothetical protein [Parasedimentitalea maritima]|uniref:hypothetical protein n=1 Tax=Parasedimentitalea maritima TaxID=2578117 RepID=UPI001BB21622|nr:hypothetical protein [Zongyanglinia marina]
MLKEYINAIVIGAAVMATTQIANAQGVDQALNEAKSRLACGAGTPVSAQYIPGGLLQVTCRQNVPNESLPNELQGTGLTPAVEVGLVAVVTTLVVVTGSSGSATTTTTTGN